LERFVKGDIVITPFPFTDLSGSKRRPALVLSDLRGDDMILYQITSQPTNYLFALSIRSEDFVSGSLPKGSFIRPSRIFTAEKTIILRKACTITPELMKKVIDAIIYILKQ
jgi:mRNA interferase MazF